MRNVHFPDQFKKTSKKFFKLHPDLVEKTRRVMKEVVVRPTSIAYKAHKLKGSLRDKWASSINYQYRVAYLFSETDIWFLDIGDHDQVY